MHNPNHWMLYFLTIIIYTLAWQKHLHQNLSIWQIQFCGVHGMPYMCTELQTSHNPLQTPVHEQKVQPPVKRTIHCHLSILFTSVHLLANFLPIHLLTKGLQSTCNPVDWFKEDASCKLVLTGVCTILLRLVNKWVGNFSSHAHAHS